MYYVVWEWKKSGIYTTRAQCEAQVKGYAWAQYQKAPSRSEAERLFMLGVSGAREEKKLTASGVQRPTHVRGQIAVDAACSGNPGVLEYQGVIIGDTREECQQLFVRGPYEQGSVNMGEFIALVSAMRYVVQQGSRQVIYSDSKTAMSWVRNRKVRTTMTESQTHPVVWSQMQQCLEWLISDYHWGVDVRKRETVGRGECPADFGRK